MPEINPYPPRNSQPFPQAGRQQVGTLRAGELFAFHAKSAYITFRCVDRRPRCNGDKSASESLAYSHSATGKGTCIRGDEASDAVFDSLIIESASSHTVTAFQYPDFVTDQDQIARCQIGHFTFEHFLENTPFRESLRIDAASGLASVRLIESSPILQIGKVHYSLC